MVSRAAVIENRPRSGSELGMELILLRGRIDMLELEFCRLAAQFAQTDFYDEAGSVSPIDWIRFHCHMTRNAAADRVAVGERIDELPESEQALWNGGPTWP